MDNVYCLSWNLLRLTNAPARILLQPEKEDNAEADDSLFINASIPSPLPHPACSRQVGLCLHVSQHADHKPQQFLQRVKARHLARHQMLDQAVIG
jgi:hypothetical protein